MQDYILSRIICSKCKSGILPSHTEKIGKEVVNTTIMNKGYDQTKYTFLQCQDCGSVWQKTIDKGAGGNGIYYSKLTNNF